MRRILITGSRKWTNDAAIHAVLDGIDVVGGPPVLVHGAAAGADHIAATYWESFGYPTEPHPANWARDRKQAGHIRNWEMVSLGAELCLAFLLNDSPGTTGCIRLAHQAGIPTTIYRETTSNGGRLF